MEVKPLNEIKRKKPDFILKNTLPIPDGSVALISASGGSGKSMYALRVSSEYVKETGRRALVWFTEDDAGTTAIRFDTMVKYLNLDRETAKKILFVYDNPKQYAIKQGGIFVTNDAELFKLQEDCLNNDIGLIVIDPLLAFYGGDENDNSQARIFMQAFINWSKVTGINIIFIHHSGKGINGSTRGAGAFQDAVRTAYEIKYILDDDGNIDFNKKDQGLRELVLTKDNRGAWEYFKEMIDQDGNCIKQIIPTISASTDTTVVEFDKEYTVPDFGDQLGGMGL